MIFFVFIAVFFQILFGEQSSQLEVNALQLTAQVSESSTIPIAVKNRKNIFHVEVARTSEQLEQGLMYRTSMPEDRGMLFVFGSHEPRFFWMKNTLIPLDIIFADTHGRIVKVWKQVPPCSLRSEQADFCPTYASEKSARYVLEINGGLAQKMSLREGNRLFLPKNLR